MSKKAVVMVLALIFCYTNIAFSGELSKEKFYINSQISYSVIDSNLIENSIIKKVRKSSNIKDWCEIGNKVIISHDKERVPSVNGMKSVFINPKMSRPFLAIRKGAESHLEPYINHINILYTEGPYTVFQATFPVLEQLNSQKNNHFYLEPIKGKMEVLLNPSKTRGFEKVKLNNLDVSETRLANYIKKLESFKTRYTYAEGFVQSAEWTRDEFKSMGLDAKLVEYNDYSKNQYNIVAQKNLGKYDGKFYIVCGHIDSTSEKNKIHAPGADDNGSGSAAVLEAALLLSKLPNSEKIRFVLFGGEEVGLKGSKAYVKQLEKSGELKNVLGVVNLDMIGFDKKGQISGLIETKRFSDDFINNFKTVSDKIGKLELSTSYNPWGSDHVPFLNKNIPCFLFIETEYGANPNYHRTTDTFKYVNMELVTGITRVVVETLATLIK